jgi:flagellar motility protein MotE (MotC chaperone)
MNGIAKKSTTKIQEIIKNTGKRVGFEAGEISQHAQKQILGGPDEIHPKILPEENQTSPITEAMQQVSKPVLTDEDKRKLQSQFMERTKKLEEEVERYRNLRKEKEKVINEANTTGSNIVKPGEPMFKPLDIPTSKPSRGRMPGMPGTAKGEAGPEVRKSKQ